MTILCFSSCQQTTIVFWHIDNTSDRQIEPDKLGLNVLRANTNHKSPCGVEVTLVNVNCLKSLEISPVVCCWVRASHDCKFEQDSLLLCSDWSLTILVTLVSSSMFPLWATLDCVSLKPSLPLSLSSYHALLSSPLLFSQCWRLRNYLTKIIKISF